MNITESKQLQLLTTTVTRLERAVTILERRINMLENQNKKLHSAVVAAQTRIGSLVSSTDSVKRLLNGRMNNT